MINTRFKTGEKVYSFDIWDNNTKGELIEGTVGHIFYNPNITITIERGAGLLDTHIPQKYVRKTKSSRHKCLVNFLENKLKNKTKECKQLKEVIKVLKIY